MQVLAFGCGRVLRFQVWVELKFCAYIDADSNRPKDYKDYSKLELYI